MPLLGIGLKSIFSSCVKKGQQAFLTLLPGKVKAIKDNEHHCIHSRIEHHPPFSLMQLYPCLFVYFYHMLGNVWTGLISQITLLII